MRSRKEQKGSKVNGKLLVWSFLFFMIWMQQGSRFDTGSCRKVVAYLPRDQHYKNDENATVVKSTLRRRRRRNETRVLKVDVYGGSITLGGAALNFSEAARYTNILATLIPGRRLKVRTLAITASGPGYWLLCGVEPTDIIVSEYRINEHDPQVLEEWYNVTRLRARHTVILELWSWLTPPADVASVSWDVFERLQKVYEREDDHQQVSTSSPYSSYSVLRMDVEDRAFWRTLVPALFANGGSYEAINPICHATALELDARSRHYQYYCAQHHAPAMQHGSFAYHERVAERLARHFTTHVLPMFDDDEEEEQAAATNSRGDGRLCIGEFGFDYARPTAQNWSAGVIAHSQGFAIHNPFSRRKDKITLNTNQVNATLKLACPLPYRYMNIGYIAHVFEDESCQFLLNNETRSNFKALPGARRIRIRQYWESMKSPVSFEIVHVPPKAVFELTDVVCSMRSDYTSVTMKAKQDKGWG